MSLKILSALLPHKHIRFNDSILTLAGRVRELLAAPHTLDELWSRVDNGATTFESLILAVDLLYAIKQIELADDGRVQAMP